MKVPSLWLDDLLSLFFPVLCASCGESLLKNEDEICTACIFHLPLTNFHRDPQNKLARQLQGRFTFLNASAYVYFRKSGMVQNIIHQLKYRGKREAGSRMGYLYGQHLIRCPEWVLPDVVIPVPLHRRKLRQRGYNQSECIAQGLSKALAIPVDTKSLIRQFNTSSQTRKSRFNRYENLRDAFVCVKSEKLEGRHVLVIDDVVTTGSTFEACCIALSKVKSIRISVAALAFAE